MSVDKGLGLFIDTLKKIGIEGVMAFLSAHPATAAIVNLPVVKQIVRYVVSKIITILLEKTELGLYFTYVDIKTSKEGSDFEKAALAHLKAQKEGVSQDEIKKLEQAKIDAARKLIKFKRY